MPPPETLCCYCLVHGLARCGEVAAGQLAVFKAVPAEDASPWSIATLPEIGPHEAEERSFVISFPKFSPIKVEQHE